MIYLISMLQGLAIMILALGFILHLWTHSLRERAKKNQEILDEYMGMADKYLAEIRRPRRRLDSSLYNILWKNKEDE